MTIIALSLACFHELVDPPRDKLSWVLSILRPAAASATETSLAHVQLISPRTVIAHLRPESQAFAAGLKFSAEWRNAKVILIVNACLSACMCATLARIQYI